VNRRNLLLTPLALALGAPSKKKKVRVGAHIWVYSAKMPRTDASPIIERIFEELSTAGLDGVELKHQVLLNDTAFPKLPALADKYKLPVIASSWSANMWDAAQHKAIEEEIRAVIDRLAKLNGSILGTTVGDARRTKTPQELDAQAKMLRTVIDIARDRGITVTLHNHIYEVKDDEYDLRNIIERVPDVKLGPDLNWLHRAKVDPASFIRRHGKRMAYAHLRDENKEGGWPEAMGEGAMDYVAIGKALHDISFAGDLAIELAHEANFTPTRSYGESFGISRAFVRKTTGY
jgi:sugar phosphate isomerase/epimerase